MSNRVAVVAPGGGYGADGPAADVLRGRRAAALGEEDHGAAVVFGKSLGSLAAPASAAVLGDVMAAVERFLDGVAWPVS